MSGNFPNSKFRSKLFILIVLITIGLLIPYINLNYDLNLLGIGKRVDRGVEIATDGYIYLEIEEISLKERVYIGYSTSLLDYGLVLDPGSLGMNNRVIYGHRFTYKSPFKKYFRDLDMVEIGDLITMYIPSGSGEITREVYRVTQVEIVHPFDTWILSQSTSKELTLITCTPINNPYLRLVIVASLWYTNDSEII